MADRYRITRHEEENKQVTDTDFVSDDKTHWVEKLFPPAFQFSLSELIGSEAKENSLLELEDRSTQFERLLRRILPEDIEAIKNVYHRVWLILRNQSQHSLAKCEGSELQTPSETEATKDEIDMVEKKLSDKSGEDILSNEALQNSCIWNSDEIGLLREASRATKEENIKLKSEIAVLKEEMAKLKKLQRNEAKQLALRTEEVQEAIKANGRLEILCRHLKKEVDKSEKTIKNLNQRLSETLKVHEGTQKEMASLCNDLDSEKLERRKFELDLQREFDDVKIEQRKRENHLEEHFKRMHVSMTEEIKNLRKELEDERRQHQRTLRGLNHLQMHFGSMPTADERETDPHQLKKWTCY